jgi:hypothetical protein
MQPPLCHDWPEIRVKLTLDVSKDSASIWGQEGSGNNKIRYVSALQKIMTTCSNFSLSARHHVVSKCDPFLCHDWLEIHLKLTLDADEDGPVIWGQKTGRNNRIQMVSVCYKKSRKLAVTFLHPHAIMVLPDATPPLP